MALRQFAGEWWPSRVKGEVTVRKGSLELHKPEMSTLKAEYDGAEGQVELAIQANREKKVDKHSPPVKW